MTKDSNEAALAYFLKAIELDENFALAYAFAGQMYVLRKQGRWMVDPSQESAQAVRLARRAVELGQMDDLVLCLSGFIFAFIEGDLDLAADCIGRGLSMNANLAWGWNFSGWVHLYLGKHQIAIEDLRRAERLSPRDPNVLQVKTAAGLAHYFDGQYREAARLVEPITREFPTFLPAWRIMAVSNALAGDLPLADKAVSKALEFDPSQTVSVLLSQMPLRRLEDRERWKDGLIRAGFPL